MIPRAAVAVLACATLVAGCGAKQPDYQSLWTTSGAATTTTPAADDPLLLQVYLKRQGVAIEQVAPSAPPDLTVSIPSPPGWSKRQNKLLPKDTVVIGKGDKYPRAVLSVFRLDGDFDNAEVVKYAVAEAKLSQDFKQLDSSFADFRGFPSAMIQGSHHDADEQRVQTWFRVVVPTGSAPLEQRYLVQLAVSALADQAEKQAGDIEAVMKGFTVTKK